jgi:hypothetical protein
MTKQGMLRVLSSFAIGVVVGALLISVLAGPLLPIDACRDTGGQWSGTDLGEVQAPGGACVWP